MLYSEVAARALRNATPTAQCTRHDVKMHYGYESIAHAIAARAGARDLQKQRHAEELWKHQWHVQQEHQRAYNAFQLLLQRRKASVC